MSSTLVGFVIALAPVATEGLGAIFLAAILVSIPFSVSGGLLTIPAPRLTASQLTGAALGGALIAAALLVWAFYEMLWGTPDAQSGLVVLFAPPWCVPFVPFGWWLGYAFASIRDKKETCDPTDR